MSRQRSSIPMRIFRTALAVGISAASLVAIPDQAEAQPRSGNGRSGPGSRYGHEPGTMPFDFSENFYRANGIDPDGLTLLVTERGGGSGAIIERQAPHPSRSNVRIIATNGGYDAGGALLFYPDPPAFMTVDAFMDNAAGQRARELADEFRAFIFPRSDGDPFSPGPPNRRQDNIFDTGLGYLTHNPLGLWTLQFVAYTDAAINGGTPEQDALMAEITARNGLDEDGTPLIRRKHEIFLLEDAELVTLYTRNKETFENGPPWVV